METKWTRKKLIKEYFRFFKFKNHKVAASSSLIPENDPTVLFTTAGMHPLVPFLLGQKHPLGRRLVNVQKCIRTTDIEEVGNETHHTFFEMLGNWSFGDYWKEDAIRYTFEFHTNILKIPLSHYAVSVFKGDKDAPQDDESSKVWESLGIPRERIAFLGKEDNWWGPAGETGPCGPDTEQFYWIGKEKPPKKFDPENKKWVEIGNDVLMEYVRDKRLILADGMHCLYDKDFKINKELLDKINSFNTHCVLVVNNHRKKGLDLIKKHSEGYSSNWMAFSLEEIGTKKDDPKYFKKLLKNLKSGMTQKGIIPEEILYFDHKKENVKTAKRLGILSKYYSNVKSTKEFIEKNLWAYLPAKQKNVDFGGGVERAVAVLNGLEDNYLAEMWKPIIEKIEKISDKKYYSDKKTTRAMRIIADHIKASVFIIADGVTPSNKERGYVLRRLLRRAIVSGKNTLSIERNFVLDVAKPIFEIYNDYDEIKKNEGKILRVIESEERKFNKTLKKGISMFDEVAGKNQSLSGKDAFLLYQSYGFPIEITEELAKEKGMNVDLKGFKKELEEHKKLSKTASKGRFASGLADHSEKTTKLHTATHLLNEALRKVLDKTIKQKGSNITPERLRFDFNFPRKLTKEEIKKVEDLVNKKINESLKVTSEEIPLEKALKSGAQSEFGAKYPEVVSVYTIGSKENPFSREICTGPHVKNTKEIGKFKIIKEQSSAAGIRRIKAEVVDDKVNLNSQ